MLIMALIEASSTLIEARTHGRALARWEPFVWELTSVAGSLLLLPLVAAAWRRWPPERLGWGRWAALHLALTVPFSLAHVALMVALREAIYAIAAAPYDFTHGGALVQLVYEWRKDAITYGLWLLVFLIDARLRRAAPARATAPAEPAARLVVRDGARTQALAIDAIIFVEAAANYVRIVHAGGEALDRGALAEFEDRLGQEGFVRVHRSRLVNRRHVLGFERTPAGDFQIELAGAQRVLGSRRYKDAVAALLEGRPAP